MTSLQAEKNRRRAAVWYVANKERAHIAARARYFKNKERHNAATKAWYEANKCQSNAKRKAYLEANPERRQEARLSTKAWVAANRERYNATKRAWAKVNTEKRKVSAAAWAKRNPEKRNIAYNRYRARKIGSGGSHTVEERREKFAEYKHLCVYCGEAKPLTEDHVIPLSRGGTDDIGNIVPACQSCNSRKGVRLSLQISTSFDESQNLGTSI